VKIIAALASIAAGLRVAPGAHHRDPERKESVAEFAGLPCAEDNPDLRKAEAQGADELHELAISQMETRLKLARTRDEAAAGSP
jgi:hypothetical protein